MSAAFALLHPGVQRWLYEQRWTQLRPIQGDAIREILGSDRDVIIAARTAGGKTEAAFLPVLSAIADDFEGSVRAMYVGPLRALINDQFRRMELLCGSVGIPVHRWHGDVGQGDRKAMLADPAGVLLITPESLEAFFVRRQSVLSRVFARLDTVVIDELHVFPGSERGMHLRSLLHRLEERRGARIRRIGLSATLGDLDRYRRWLRPSDSDRVALVNHPREGGELKTKCYAFTASAPMEDDETDAEDPPAQQRQQIGDESTELHRTLLAHHRQGINLVFANAKRVLEDTVTGMRSAAAAESWPEERILIHHGSLSREIREDAERLLQSGGDRICCCSSTLELGIDIGAVRAVGHLDAPWSVASLAQRLGRSGRRADEAAVFRQYHILDPLDDLPPTHERHLRPGLVRGIALVQLYLEGWCESAEVDRRHASTLVHQIISSIAEVGGITAEGLYRQLVGGDGFAPMSTSDFAILLRHLGSQQVIEQISDGSLLLGSAGETELSDRGFYAAFQSAEQYDVTHLQRRIGSISIENAFLLGDGFRLGGRSWEVEEVDERRLRLYVRPSSRRNLPKFSGTAGIVHDRVVAQMHSVLVGEKPVAFLDDSATEALTAARAHFRRIGLDTQQLIADDTGVTLWPWRGTRVVDTLLWALRADGFDITSDALSLRVEGATLDGLVSALHRTSSNLRESILDGFSRMPAKLLWREKYDYLLPGDLLAEAMLTERLDLDGTQVAIAALTSAARDATGA